MGKDGRTNDQRYIDIGLKIAFYRKRNNWTQEYMAEKANISVGYLSQVESLSFVQPISLKLLFTLADLFEIPPAKFLETD